MPHPTHPLLQSVPRAAFEKLEIYAALLEQWQQHMPLVSANDIRELWVRHIADSLQLLPLIPDKTARIVDIGSGAGFPGLPLAITGYQDVHLVESNQRKCAFLREAARRTDTPVTIHPIRAETLDLAGVALVTSRGCSHLSNLLTILWNWPQKNVTCLFHKGQNYLKEVDELRDWDLSWEAIPSQTDPGGVIIKITQFQKVL